MRVVLTDSCDKATILLRVKPQVASIMITKKKRPLRVIVFSW